MITLRPNTAGQSVYLTLREKAKDIASYTHYLVIFTNMMSREEYAFVANVSSDNDRYTKIDIDTDSATSGNVLITETGEFWYAVYAQNSSSNLIPTNGAVVAEIERGTLHVQTQETFYNASSVTIPDNIIYYQ